MGRLDLLNGAELVGGVARDADVVVALEDELDVADVKGVRTADFRELASGDSDLVDEVVGDFKEGLGRGE